MATDAVRAIGERTRRAADWLEQREPADVVREARGFARRHTGAFLVIALGVGLVAGRLTRALVAESRNGGSRMPRRDLGSTGSRPTLASTGAGTGTAGGDGSRSRPSTAVADASGGDTPIADALAGDLPSGDPLAAGDDDLSTTSRTQDEWSPSGEARR